MKLHYFKVKEDLPRVQVVLSFLQGIVPAGLCNTLLDVGSGRGVFLFPLLREFPELEVTSLDILSHRVALHECIHDGGVENLHPILENICTWNAPDKSFDVVTMLEVGAYPRYAGCGEKCHPPGKELHHRVSTVKVR